tara:strand:- start:91 stop:309 length:219 start_codon:yes stop_codon:yes gene_type:complete
MSKEEDSELIIIISEQGSVIVVSLNERGLSKEQFNMIERVTAISEPSFVLFFFLYIEIYLNRLMDKIKDFWR